MYTPNLKNDSLEEGLPFNFGNLGCPSWSLGGIDGTKLIKKCEKNSIWIVAVIHLRLLQSRSPTITCFQEVWLVLKKPLNTVSLAWAK